MVQSSLVQNIESKLGIQIDNEIILKTFSETERRINNYFNFWLKKKYMH